MVTNPTIERLKKELDEAVYEETVRQKQEKAELFEKNKLLEEMFQNGYEAINNQGRFWLVKSGRLIRRLFDEEIDIIKNHCEQVK